MELSFKTEALVWLVSEMLTQMLSKLSLRAISAKISPSTS